MHMAVITAFTYVDVEMTAVFLSMDVEVMAVYCPVNVVLTALLNSWTRSNVLLGGCGGDSTVQLADVEVTSVLLGGYGGDNSVLLGGCGGDNSVLLGGYGGDSHVLLAYVAVTATSYLMEVEGHQR